MKNQDLEQQEYQTRIRFFKTDFTGKLHVPTKANFHPYLFIGTQEEYDFICKEYLTGKEDEFKIIGVHVFDTKEEYWKEYGNLISA